MRKINSFAEELESVRRDAGIFVAQDWGQIAVSGSDAPGFLHRMLSNEVQKLPAGQGRYNGLLDRKAMTLSLFFLFRQGDQEFLAVTPPQLKEKTLTLLTKMKFIEKVTIRDVSGERGLLTIVGPQAELILKDLPSSGWLSWRDEAFKVPAWSVSGPRLEVESFAQISQYLQLRKDTVRLLKIEAGFPEYGVDLDESHILLEANLPFTYQRQKGCYPGQEVIERILAYGKGRTPKRLCVLTLDEERLVEKGADVIAADGQKAGVVTSSIYDPLARRTVILAYLDHKYVGEALRVRWSEGTVRISDGH